MKAQLQQIKQEWKHNRRLRLGTVAIAAILAWYGLLNWNDYIDTREKIFARGEQKLSQLRSASGTAELWKQRASDAAESRAQLESMLWEAPSTAAAQATIEDWLRTTLAEVYAARPEVRAQIAERRASRSAGQETSTREAEQPRLKFSISFEYSGQTIERFLGAIYSQPHLVRVINMNAKKSGKAEFILQFAVKLPKAALEKSATEDKR